MTSTDPHAGDHPVHSRWALVTGSTSGIGRATALALSQDGFSVVVTGRDVQRAAEVCDEVRARGGTAVAIIADLREPDAVRRLAGSALEAAGGHVAALVNNAGGGTFATTESTTDEQFEESIAVLVRAPFVLVGLLAPVMAERSEGAIVNVASIGVQLAVSGQSLFNAGKAALQSLTRS